MLPQVVVVHVHVHGGGDGCRRLTLSIAALLADGMIYMFSTLMGLLLNERVCTVGAWM